MLDRTDIYWCGYYDGYYDLETDKSISWCEAYWYGIEDGDDDYYWGIPYRGWLGE